MATHKVPQDVEAEDKLLGPLSLKQFIFVILGLGFGYLTFFFVTKIHPITGIIWLPFMLVFLVLGLYQRKDQPAEVFLASALRYFLKPRTRIWNQEGYQERVIITAPPKIDRHYTKDFTSEEATSRLGNLSRLMDTRGWATRLHSEWQNPALATAAASDRIVQPADIQQGTGINAQAYMQPVDVMDESTSFVAQGFQTKINQTDTSTRQHALQVLEQARQQPADDQTQDTDNTIVAAQNEMTTGAPQYQQYPQMHQKVVTPSQQGIAQSGETATAEQQAVINEPVESTPQQNEDVAQSEPLQQERDDGSVEVKLH